MKKKLKIKLPKEEPEAEEKEILEELRGHRIICTCQEDPKWCEIHNLWN